MEKFINVLNDLLNEKGIKATKLAKDLHFSHESVIYSWSNAGKIPKLDKAVAIADYFECSLDYLFGRTENFEKIKTKKKINFGTQLKKTLKEKNITQIQLIKDLNLSGGYLYNWITLNAMPRMDLVIRIADYLGVSLDYLVGREK